MRIVAGTLGGRQFESPGTAKTHPMGDKVRGALFNILGDIEGLTVLDAFAGSGALCFEAISRGAASALAIEVDKAAQRAINDNVAALQLGDKIRLIRATANAWLQTSSNQTFDLVLCDPPYSDPQEDLIKQLAVRVKPGGLLALSWPLGTALPILPDCTMLDHRSYGDAGLAFYRKIQ